MKYYANAIAAQMVLLRIIAGVWLGLMSTATLGQTANALTSHPSPYLAMHAADPVSWRLWGQEAIDESRRTGKLLFVSSGNYSCYWCHVMQRENYLNPRIATLINQNFIPVLIDSELQPALDAQLMDFLNHSLGYAGWPLQVFITPEGYPLAGTVYAPFEDFEPMLVEISGEWKKDGKDLAMRAKQAAAAHKQFLPPASDVLDKGVGESSTSALISQALTASDGEQGGFGKQSKFPSSPQLQALLLAYSRTHEILLKNFLVLTLDHMANGGLRDQLGGGFFRYTTDRNWQEPHFEKMLYDNAQLAILYLQAARILDRPDYSQIGQETLDFMLREMSGSEGGMMASLSAVGESMREGEYYLWNRADLEALLTPAEFRALSQSWDMKNAAKKKAAAKDAKDTKDTNYLPRRSLPALQSAGGATDPLLLQARKKLLDARNARSLPHDGKQLAGLNGLVLAALAQGAQLPNGENYRRASQSLRDYLVKTLWDGKQLHRLRISKSGVRAEGTLEDYALTAKGLLAWSQVSRNLEDSRLAGLLVDEAWRRFYNDKTGWRLEQRSLLPIESAVAALPDGTLPSASATLLSTSLDLAKTNKDNGLRKRAISALNTGRVLVNENPFVYASYITALVQAQN